jgi:hypothetical protein
MIPIMPWCTSEIHHHIYLVHIIRQVNCCMRYNDLCCRLRKMCRPSCTFGGSTYSEEQKPDTNHLFVLKYQKILRRNSKQILQDMVKRKMKRTKLEMFC